MNKLLSLLIVVNLLLFPAGCRERKSENIVKLAKQPDLNLAVSARFIQSDGSYYLTEQQHSITIKPKTLAITAHEPFGRISLNTTDEKFNILNGYASKKFDRQLYELMTNETICKALLELYLAQLENSQSISNQAKVFSFEGQSYVFVYSENNIEIYKNNSTQKQDLALTTGDKRYILFGYNYIKYKEDGYIPSKIDVYSDGLNRKLIAQYEGTLK